MATLLDCNGEFSKTFFKLSTLAGLLRRRRGGCGSRRGLRGPPAQQEGSRWLPSPAPHMPGTGEAGTHLRGRGASHDAFPQSPGRPAFSLPALSCRGRSPSTSRPHTDPLDGQPAKQSGTGITAGPGGGSGSRGISFFPQLPSPFLFLSSGFVRVLPGFTLLHRHFVCQSPHAPDTVLTRDRTEGATKGEGGGKRGRAGGGSRLPWHSVQRGGGGGWEVLQRHFAN